MSISFIFELITGLAMFLFGMNAMGDGLKKVAGSKLETVLWKLSSTPTRGVLLGTGVTAVIQSSSATSCMVVGFVNSGMMNIAQAIGIIMGANIGTTATGWILSLSAVGGDSTATGFDWTQFLSTTFIAAVFALIGTLFMMFAKKASLQHTGSIMLGFAVLMSGMKMMSGAMGGLEDSQVFKDMITNPKYGSVKEGVRVWNEYVYSFGFGRKLGTDLYGEGAGNVPTPEDYDKKYNGRWNYGSVLSCSIGQGEMGCTPLQMANLAAIIANRGYYYTPHLVKSIEGRDSIDARFYERHYTMVDSIHYVPIVEGMWRSVNVSGTSRTAYLEGWDVCGKTGTAENSGPDHSTFLSFAPKDNPQIAISVYVEHGGFGSAIAVPIASLIEEMYLTDTIQRPHLIERVKNAKPNYRIYDERQRKYDAKRNKK